MGAEEHIVKKKNKKKRKIEETEQSTETLLHSNGDSIVKQKKKKKKNKDHENKEIEEVVTSESTVNDEPKKKKKKKSKDKLKENGDSGEKEDFEEAGVDDSGPFKKKFYTMTAETEAMTKAEMKEYQSKQCITMYGKGRKKFKPLRTFGELGFPNT